MLFRSMRKQLRRILLLKGIKNAAVLDAIEKIPRHFFLDKAFEEHAYEDKAFKIGAGQTISQPYTVAVQTELLQLKKNEKVLEIGTGCGYQTAVLSKVAAEVYSLERISPLVMKARKHLRETRMSNIKLKHADGTMGLPDFGPFDGIIVTAAASHIPEDLMQQLAIGGRMVIPVGVEEQVLHMIERTESDGGTEFIKTKLEPVKFVPLLGGTN